MSFTITADGDEYVFTNSSGSYVHLSHNQAVELASELAQLPASPHKSYVYEGFDSSWCLYNRVLTLRTCSRAVNFDGSDIPAFLAQIEAIL